MKTMEFVQEWNRNARKNGSVMDFAVVNGLSKAQALKKVAELNAMLGRKPDGSTYLLEVKETAAHRISDAARLRQLKNEEFLVSLHDVNFQTKVRTKIGKET